MDIRDLRQRLAEGLVIPAHPLALDVNRRLDERRQAALTRYYRAAGAGGVAIGVHTTQFAIRDSNVGLFEPVLALAADVAREQPNDRPAPLLVAGVCGDGRQSRHEAEIASRLGYDAALVSLATLQHASHDELISHCRVIADISPVFGFYLQPAVGGILLGYEFWRAFFEIPQVVAVKVAPFDRYQTLDVVRALAASGRTDEIALYTGNDDNIVVDLLSEFRIGTGTGTTILHFSGGLLGQWAVGTRQAVELLDRVKSCRKQPGRCTYEILAEAASLTDTNAALFDAANGFAGCIAGVHEVLRRQGLMAGRWCLDPNEDLSPGQLEEIDRVSRSYPQWHDDAFIAARLGSWLR
jgi:dihydrodipicolinate synthase/N-acetylneuraminate lyase